MKKQRMIKKRWIIGAVVILVIVVVLGALYLLQQDNIKAAANARRYTQAQLQEQLEESREAVETVLTEQYPDVRVRDLTDEERAALRQGELSVADLVDLLTGGDPRPSTQPEGPSATDAPEPTQAPETAAPGPSHSGGEPTAAPTGTPSPTSAPTAAPAPSPSPDPDEAYQTELARIIAEVYILREEFTAMLEGMVEEAREEYHAMPESERTKSKLVSWAAGYAEKASVLEKQCDARMDEIAQRLSNLCAQYGRDNAIIYTLVESYAQEKSIQKSLYIQELEKRGIM